MRDVRINLADCERVLMNEIAMKETTRDTLAITYAMAISAGEIEVWSRVNRAIIERWSKSGLTYIKTKAWKMIEEKNKPTD